MAGMSMILSKRPRRFATQRGAIARLDGAAHDRGYQVTPNNAFGLALFNEPLMLRLRKVRDSRPVAVFGTNQGSCYVDDQGYLHSFLGNAKKLGLSFLAANSIARCGIDIMEPTPSNYVKVDALMDGMVGIRADGTAWYSVFGGIIPGTTAPVQIGVANDWVDCHIIGSLITNTSLAQQPEAIFLVKADGTLWGFGRNNRLGNGILNTTNNAVLTQIGTDTDWIGSKFFGTGVAAAATTNGAVFALKANGNLYSAGYASDNALGVNQASFTLIPFANPIRDVLISPIGNFALDNLGAIYSWKQNRASPSPAPTLTPELLGTFGADILQLLIIGYANFSGISTEIYQQNIINGGLCFLKNDGDLYNFKGADLLSLVEQRQTLNANIQRIIRCHTDNFKFTLSGATGFLNTYVADTGNGQLMTISDNVLSGEALGGSVSEASTVIHGRGIRIRGQILKTKKLALENNKAFALTDDGKLFIRGNFASGTAGNGNMNYTAEEWEALEPSLTFTDVQVSTQGTFALRDDGVLMSSGSNSSGTTVQGTATGTTNTLTAIANATNVKQFSHASNSLLLVKNDGTLWVGGLNGSGQIGLGATASSTTLVQIGSDTDWDVCEIGIAAGYAKKINGEWHSAGLVNFIARTTSPTPNNLFAPINTPFRDFLFLKAGKDVSNGFLLRENGELYTYGNPATLSFDGAVTVSATQLFLVATDVIDAFPDAYMYVKRDGSMIGSFRPIAPGVGAVAVSLNRPLNLSRKIDWVEAQSTRYFNYLEGQLVTNQLFAMGYDEAGADGDAAVDLENGGLGDSLQRINTIPNDVDSISRPRVVSGADFTHLVKNDGTLWFAGNPAGNQAGDSALVLPVGDFVQIGSAADWASVSNSNSHTLAVKTNGQLWGCGQTTLLNPGDPLAGHTNLTQLGVVASWRAARALQQASVLLQSNGTLWSFGRNIDGITGQGVVTGDTQPITQIGAATNWRSVAGRYRSVAAIRTDGTLWTWGNNASEALGRGASLSDAQRSTPTQVGTDTDWLRVFAGIDGFIAIKRDGSAWGWGNNGNGLLGVNSGAASIATPTLVAGSGDWDSFSLGTGFALGIKKDGTLWGAGRDDSFQLNGVVVTNSQTFVQLDGGSDWQAAYAGDEFSLVKKVRLK